MLRIRKAVIPAAGFGTRFLPQTKAMPKEMMPLVDKPIIQRVVEELVEVGIETIIIVTGLHKRAIEDHFDNLYELEDRLHKAGKHNELETVKKIADMAEFVYVRQKGPPGNATPILNSRNILGNEPFMVFWGDDFIDASPSRAKQLLTHYQNYQSCILGAIRVHDDPLYERYAFAAGKKVNGGVIKVQKIMEKPGKEKAPSNLAIISGFVFTPDIHEALLEAKAQLGGNEELVYTLGVQKLVDEGVPVFAAEIENALYRDCGNKLDYLKTIIDYAWEHEEFGKEIKDYVSSKITTSVN